MQTNCSPQIELVQKGSIAERLGILPGDRLISINGNKIRDEIDLMYYSSDMISTIVVKRAEKKISFEINDSITNNLEKSYGLGIILKPFKIKTCKNKCIFCFVSQLPKGMRKSLYIKDEDYRMSFLYGNYITLTNLSYADKKRIISQKLSPLYISVHSTNRDIRNRLLGNSDAPDILKEIKFFANNGIRMHAQIVLCPTINDGKNLEKTISDLYKFYPYVISIAVVPVGITKYTNRLVKPVEKIDAINTIKIIQKFQNRFKKRYGEPIVYASDEMYIKAGIPIPPIRDYGDLAQIENGVGMIASFMHQARKIKIQKPFPLSKDNVPRFVTFTGVSFYPYLMKFIEKLKDWGVDIEAFEIKNDFFGESVTVAGLLTGRDVMKFLTGKVKKDSILLIPDVVMKENEDIFLDDISKNDIEYVLGLKSLIIESNPQGLLRAITDEYKQTL